MFPELLRSREVARRLDISVRTVWRWTARGELPAPIRMGRVTRWRRIDVEEYLVVRRRLLPNRPA
jgi:excisionase family DNA binding protein